MFEGLYYSLDPYIYIYIYVNIYIYPLGNGGYHNGTPYQPSVHCFISTKAEVRLSSTMTLRERTPDVWRHRGIGDALQPKTFQRLNLRCESLSVSNPHLGVRVIYLSIYLSIYLYLSLSIFIYHYLSLSIIIYHYLSLSIIIYHYLSLSIIIYHYLSLSIIIYHYLSLSIIIYLSIYLSLSIYLFIYLFIYHYLSIYLCIHTHT